MTELDPREARARRLRMPPAPKVPDADAPLDELLAPLSGRVLPQRLSWWNGLSYDTRGGDAS